MLTAPDQRVHEMRHILLWPLQIDPGYTASESQKIHQILTGSAEAPSQWTLLADEFTANPEDFQERHYKEFVTFLPYVQRFLYGEGRSSRRPADDPPSEASVTIYRRQDVKHLRVVLQEGEVPLMLEIAHVDLYFFRDLDIAILNVELVAKDLKLKDALEQLYRFGRAFPAGWDDLGHGLHNTYSSEWLDASGAVLMASDSGDRAKYLAFACRHRSPAIAAHWNFLLAPLVLDQSDDAGAVRYRLIEVYRMPFMAYLALDRPRALSREDFMRIAMVSQLRPTDPFPVMSEAEFKQNEQRLYEDRFWTANEEGPMTRFFLNGHSLITLGNAYSPFFTDPNRGQLAQFRHQIFLLFMIAHAHRAALLSFSDQLADATNDLDLQKLASIARFKRRIRGAMESFLRFSHRYWFHELSEHALVQSLFKRTAKQLGNDVLYREVREEIRDMSEYLDSDAQRRQSGTMMRLTVVTTFGLIGTVATGFLGMNLISEAEAPIPVRIGYFFLVMLGSGLLTLFAVARSPRLAEVLETVADEKASIGDKLASFRRVFQRRKGGV